MEGRVISREGLHRQASGDQPRWADDRSPGHQAPLDHDHRGPVQPQEPPALHQPELAQAHVHQEPVQQVGPVNSLQPLQQVFQVAAVKQGPAGQGEGPGQTGQGNQEGNFHAW